MQINRLFEIIYVLINADKVTAQKLADRFEVSTRTIYRDIECLSSAGVPIYMQKGKGGGIALLPNYVLNKAVLTSEEQLSITASLKALDAVSRSSSKAAFDKLNSLFGGQSCNWIEVDFSNWGDGEREKRVFEVLKGTILQRKKVSFKYNNGKGEFSQRTVQPLKLIYKGYAWYLFGYCEMRNENRFFKLSRVVELAASNENFIKNVSERVLENHNEFFANSIEIKLKFSKKMAFLAYDEFENLEEIEDGFIATMNFPESRWILSYIMSFGECCTVLGPEWIKKEIKNQLSETLKNYS